ncbi:hypothetical protein PI125_g5110 [Phytophthora idaei]|nr:hypothetical protein PI125_g5110 [Phytophthora idaei]
MTAAAAADSEANLQSSVVYGTPKQPSPAGRLLVMAGYGGLNSLTYRPIDAWQVV